MKACTHRPSSLIPWSTCALLSLRAIYCCLYVPRLRCDPTRTSLRCITALSYYCYRTDIHLQHMPGTLVGGTNVSLASS